MASEDEEDLVALRNAVLASMKTNRTRSSQDEGEPSDEDDELTALRKAALLSKKSRSDNTLSTTDRKHTSYQHRDDGHYYEDHNHHSSDSRRNYSNNSYSSRHWDDRGHASVNNRSSNLVHIHTVPMEREQPSKLDTQIIRPQDKWLGSDDRSGTSTPTSSKTKIVDKFSRYESNSEDDEDNQSSDEEEQTKDDKQCVSDESSDSSTSSDDEDSKNASSSDSSSSLESGSNEKDTPNKLPEENSKSADVVCNVKKDIKPVHDTVQTKTESSEIKDTNPSVHSTEDTKSVSNEKYVKTISREKEHCKVEKEVKGVQSKISDQSSENVSQSRTVKYSSKSSSSSGRLIIETKSISRTMSRSKSPQSKSPRSKSNRSKSPQSKSPRRLRRSPSPERYSSSRNSKTSEPAARPPGKISMLRPEYIFGPNAVQPEKPAENKTDFKVSTLRDEAGSKRQKSPHLASSQPHPPETSRHQDKSPIHSHKSKTATARTRSPDYSKGTMSRSRSSLERSKSNNRRSRSASFEKVKSRNSARSRSPHKKRASSPHDLAALRKKVSTKDWMDHKTENRKDGRKVDRKDKSSDDKSLQSKKSAKSREMFEKERERLEARQKKIEKVSKNSDEHKKETSQQKKSRLLDENSSRKDIESKQRKHSEKIQEHKRSSRSKKPADSSSESESSSSSSSDSSTSSSDSSDSDSSEEGWRNKNSRKTERETADIERERRQREKVKRQKEAEERIRKREEDYNRDRMSGRREDTDSFRSKNSFSSKEDRYKRGRYDHEDKYGRGRDRGDDRYDRGERDRRDRFRYKDSFVKKDRKEERNVDKKTKDSKEGHYTYQNWSKVSSSDSTSKNSSTEYKSLKDVNGEKPGSGDKVSSLVEVAVNENKNNSNKYEMDKNSRTFQKDNDKGSRSLQKDYDKRSHDVQKDNDKRTSSGNVQKDNYKRNQYGQKESDKGSSSRSSHKDNDKGSNQSIKKDIDRDIRPVQKDEVKDDSDRLVQKNNDKANHPVQKDKIDQDSAVLSGQTMGKEQRRKRFMDFEEEKAETEKEIPPKKLLTSIVSVTSKTSDSQGNSSSKDPLSHEQLVKEGKSKSKKRHEEEKSKEENAKTKNFTVTIDNKGFKERSVVTERSRSPALDGHHHTKVVWRDEASKACPETSPPKRLSIHDRLGQPVHHKKAKMQRHNDDRRHELTVTRRVETTDSELPKKTIIAKETPKTAQTVTEPPGHLSDLDARILLIKKKNAEILKRQAEIAQDKERYG